MTAAVKCCKTCRWLDVPADKSGRITVRRGNGYRCLVPLPDVALPSCVLSYYSFAWPPPRSYMTGDKGTDCALYEKRIPA